MTIQVAQQKIVDLIDRYIESVSLKNGFLADPYTIYIGKIAYIKCTNTDRYVLYIYNGSTNLFHNNGYYNFDTKDSILVGWLREKLLHVLI